MFPWLLPKFSGRGLRCGLVSWLMWRHRDGRALLRVDNGNLMELGFLFALLTFFK